MALNRESIIQAAKSFLEGSRSYKPDPGRLGKVSILRKVSEVEALVDYLIHDTVHPFVAIDIESVNTVVLPSKVGRNEVITIQLCDDGENGYVIPIDHKESPWKSKPKTRAKVVEQIRRLFEHPEPKFTAWLAHFAQFEDSQLLQWLGTRPTNRPLIDTRQAAHLIDENRLEFRQEDSAFGLKDLSEIWLGFQHYTQDEKEIRAAGGLHAMSLDDLSLYGAKDVWVTVRLMHYVLRRAKDEGFQDSLRALLQFMLSNVVHLESHLKRTGFRVDVDLCFNMLQPDGAVQGQINLIENELRKMPEVKKANRILARMQNRGGDKGLPSLLGEPWVLQFNNRVHRAVLFFVACNLPPRPLTSKERQLPSGTVLTEFDPDLAFQKNPRVPPMDKAFMTLHRSEWSAKDGVWKGNLNDKGEPMCLPITKMAERQELLTLRNLFLKKLFYSYVRPSDPSPDCADGSTRSTYDFASTVTGRGSSYDPNGQQIPRADNEAKRRVKDVFITRPGYAMIVMDFKANEVRWGCICSGDEVLADLFIRGKEAVDKYERTQTKKDWDLAAIADDIHKQTASLVFGIKDIYKYDWGSSEAKVRRNIVKTIVFGVFYGRGANAISQQLGVSVDEAKQHIQNIKARFPRLFEFLEWCASYAKDHGYIESPLGRRRRLTHLFQQADVIDAAMAKGAWKEDEIAKVSGLPESTVRQIKAAMAQGGRLAKNTPIQSVASDCNNIGAFEFLSEIEPELKPLSPYRKAIAKRDSRFTEMGRLTAEALSETGSDLAGILDAYRESMGTPLDAMLHNIVHDSISVGARLSEVPTVVETMRKCFVDRSTKIMAKVFGVNMIAPLGVEFEIGTAYGSTKAWGWDGDKYTSLESMLERVGKDLAERDARLKNARFKLAV